MEFEFQRSFDELDRILDIVDEACREAGGDEKVSLAVRIMAEEIFTNFVKYNRGGREHIVMTLEIVSDRLCLSFTDHDVEPFDLTSLPDVDVTAPAAERSPGGLGVHLIRHYADEVTSEYAKRTMTVTVTKQLEAGNV